MLSKLIQAVKRFYKFLGEDSLASWVANVIVAFVVIYFIVYPGLGFFMQTSLPVVAVVSSSMEHNGQNFETWWTENGNQYEDFPVAKEDFENYRFKNGFNKGDIMVIYGAEPKDIKVGDVVVYRSTINPNPIIHRVVNIEEGSFKTKGDNNHSPDQNLVQPSQIKDTGIAIFRLPYLGWIKIIFVKLIGG